MEFTKYLQTCCNRFFLRVESCPLGAQGCAIICLSSLRQARFSIRVFLMYVSHGSCSLRVHLYLGDSAPPCPNDPQMFSLDCYQSKRRGGGMCEWKPQLVKKKRTAWAASTLWLGFLLLAITLVDTRAVATPPPSLHVRAIPAFARKYGMPCSACHEAWPKLNNFGQTFKDNGYQMMNDRDAPIFQQAAYWPVAFRITPNWHRESSNRVAVDDPNNPGSQIEQQVT